MKKRVKTRNSVERDLLTSGLYRMRVVKSKKRYSRKRRDRGEDYDIRSDD